MCLLLTVARSRKRRGLLQICTKYCHWLIELIFIFITLGSIYGFYMLKNDAIPRYIAITCECVTMITSLIAKCHERRLHKRAARVRPIGMKAKTAVQPVTSDRRGMSVKKKNKIVSRNVSDKNNNTLNNCQYQKSALEDLPSKSKYLAKQVVIEFMTSSINFTMKLYRESISEINLSDIFITDNIIRLTFN